MKALQPAESGQGNLIPVTGLYITSHLEVLEARQVPVYQVLRNPDGLLRAQAVAPRVAVALPSDQASQKQFLIDRRWQQSLFEADDRFGAQIEELLAEPPAERTKALASLRTTLAELKLHDAPAVEKAQVIMDVVSRAFLLNKASLKLRPSEVTADERTVAKDTTSIVATALEMTDDPALVSGLFTVFQGLSNGQTVDHVARVFASYSGFLRFYNRWHQNRLSQVLRRCFAGVYLPAYRRLLPGVEERYLTSDQVLQLPQFEALDLKEFALGAFLHDIGKMGNIDYFESDLAYDPQQIRQHVFLSAGLILMNYGNDHDGARLLAGDHHNALGHAGGYGVTRLEQQSGHRVSLAPVRCLAGQSEDYVSGASLGWLPVEMLAVADVYDAMIDTSRAYKKALSPAEAVVFLEDTMVSQGKLDPFLVDLYVDYLRAQSLDIPADRGFQHKIGRSASTEARP